MEEEMIESGGSEKKRDKLIDGMSKMSLEDRKIVMSPEEYKIKTKGEQGQGEDLYDKKKVSSKKKKS
jgi:hypothetical protein